MTLQLLTAGKYKKKKQSADKKLVNGSCIHKLLYSYIKTQSTSLDRRHLIIIGMHCRGRSKVAVNVRQTGENPEFFGDECVSVGVCSCGCCKLLAGIDCCTFTVRG